MQRWHMGAKLFFNKEVTVQGNTNTEMKIIALVHIDINMINTISIFIHLRLFIRKI